jgi:hypothetical protein
MSPNVSSSISPVRARRRKRQLANLKEALELHFEPPHATRPAIMRMIEVEVGAP